MADEIKIRNMLILDEERKKTVKIKDEQYGFMAILNKDRKDIARRIAYEQNGMPANSFGADDRYRFERDATLDQALIDKPSWWKSATENPDDELAEQLFKEITDWSKEFQEKLKKNQFSARGATP